jgi:hypothetical protein
MTDYVLQQILPWERYTTPRPIAPIRRPQAKLLKNGKPVRPPRLDELPSAKEVIRRFGGARNLMRWLGYVGLPHDPACVYRWSYPYPKGSGGRIPRKAWVHVQVAAKKAKVNLDGIPMLPRIYHHVRRFRISS